MTRRRHPPRPSPGRDWRAIAEPRPQHTLGLPVPVIDDRPHDALADIVLRVRRLPDGTRFVRLAIDVTLEDAAVVRALAARLLDAARSIEAAGTPSTRDPVR